MKARGQRRTGVKALVRRAYSARALAAPVAFGLALLAAGCNTEGNLSLSGKAAAPIPPALLSEIDQRNMEKTSPILVRLFKEEAELEVWKQDRTGRYALLKTYPICRWSGELGPKVKEGDRQAPEGFYNIAPGQMNPNSQYYLSFNLGYPNAYDQAWGRTGSQLMVHGDCSSRGCYAMTDEQITEIFALGRESFFGGQQSFQVQAYPFRMTPQNMAKHRNNPNYVFWKMLKRGNDHFEVTRLEPKVDVCEKKYVFDAEPVNASTPLRFNPAGRCPVYTVPQDVAAAVNDKQRREELQTAQLISRGAPTSPARSYADGGMNKVFYAALQQADARVAAGEAPLATPIRTEAGTIPTSVNPPRVVESASPAPARTVVAAAPAQPAPAAKPEAKPSLTTRIGSLFKPAEKPAPQPAAQPEPAASKAAEAPKKEGITAKITRKLGLRGGETTAAAESAKPETAAKPEPAKAPPAAPGAIRPAAVAQSAPPATPSTTGSLMTGAQPIPSTSSFDSRFAFR
jgi:murein L,D-transpeptidase YafK